MFNKQHFEDQVYALVVSLVNEYFSTPRTPTETIKALREMLQALHFVIEEEITQIVYGLLMLSNKREN